MSTVKLTEAGREFPELFQKLGDMDEEMHLGPKQSLL